MKTNKNETNTCVQDTPNTEGSNSFFLNSGKQSASQQPEVYPRTCDRNGDERDLR